VHAFDVLGDPVRRTILELLAEGERTAGQVAVAVQDQFGISPSAVSQHLRVLRDNGFTTMRVDRQFRVYAISGEPFREVDAWLERYRGFWAQRLDALDTEIARERTARPTRELTT
jgi:DNA-binding transcriptional ArsR family regulator